mgnify:CR=1 FL=1
MYELYILGVLLIVLSTFIYVIITNCRKVEEEDLLITSIPKLGGTKRDNYINIPDPNPEYLKLDGSF